MSRQSPTTAAEIREAFLSYYEKLGHRRVASHSLLPPADPTLLFVNAGMVQFKDYFTGARPAPWPSATSTQKCLRVSGKHNDLENVGRTRRHHTLFEMLGNFSFGDYFKRTAIETAWTFLIKHLHLPVDRMIVTYFEGDDAVPADTEARDLWAAISGLPDERIFPMTAKDNFWAMGDTGPCGPCSEIYFDLWPEQGESTFPQDESRYMEIWNLVFMQYDRQFDGSLLPLPAPAVDTGMGLERIASVVQRVSSNYEIDLLRELIAVVEMLTDVPYGGRFTRRATSFLIGEAVFPDNEGRGYVLRRVMRRAIRFGRKLGLEEPFLFKVCDRVVELMGDVFPELLEQREVIGRVVRQEEERFGKTLAEGERLIQQSLARLEMTGAPPILDGETVFLLYDSNGFPTDLTALIAAEHGFAVDMAGFEAAMERQRERGRASWQGADDAGGVAARDLAERGMSTRFFGYLTDEVGNAEVLAILGEGGRLLQRVGPGQKVQVVLGRTPFYGESGGQVGDRGTLTWGEGGSARVTDTLKPLDTLYLHVAEVVTGELEVGERIRATVDTEHRAGVRAHHSATHLLHRALRNVLGAHVKQRGSLVDSDRLRFDYSHYAAMTDDEIAGVEQQANRMVLANLETSIQNCGIDEARAQGALMFFGDKYGEQVRVVEMGESIELCGGTHVSRTGDIGLIKVLGDSGVSAGVRRLEAECHLAVLGRMQSAWAGLGRVAQRFNAKVEDADDRVAATLDTLRKLEREVRDLRQQLVLAEAAAGSGGADEDDGAERRTFGDFVAVARVVDGVGGKDLRVLGDRERDRLSEGAALVISRLDKGKQAVIVAVTPGSVGQVHAGKTLAVVVAHLGGRGGGRPDFAQGGGSNVEGVEKAVAAFFAAVGEALSVH